MDVKYDAKKTTRKEMEEAMEFSESFDDEQEEDDIASPRPETIPGEQPDDSVFATEGDHEVHEDNEDDGNDNKLTEARSTPGELSTILRKTREDERTKGRAVIQQIVRSNSYFTALT